MDPFVKQQWVVGIDSLEDLDWIENYPDGQILRERFYLKSLGPEYASAIIRPMRDIARLMLTGISHDPNTDPPFQPMLEIHRILTEQVQIWQDEGALTDPEIIFREDLDVLRRLFPSASKTIDSFVLALQNEAREILNMANLS